MVEPTLKYAAHKAFNGEVATTISFVPVFHS